MTWQMAQILHCPPENYDVKVPDGGVIVGRMSRCLEVSFLGVLLGTVPEGQGVRRRSLSTKGGGRSGEAHLIMERCSPRIVLARSSSWVYTMSSEISALTTVICVSWCSRACTRLNHT